jgi:signal peptidase I
MVPNTFLKALRAHCVARRKVLYFALCLCLASFSVLHWIIWPVIISGDSMIPSYHDGQPTYINKLAYWLHPPQRGDVVGVSVGDDFYIKRIIGVPGDKIEFKRGTVVVNGTPLVEPYVERPLLWWLRPVHLGADQYFVMGDNRTSSTLGSVKMESIVGKAVY